MGGADALQIQCYVLPISRTTLLRSRHNHIAASRGLGAHGGECSPDGRGGAYKVVIPSSSNPWSSGECDIASPYYVNVDHYPEDSCTSAKDSSSFIVFTDGDCSQCCDITTGICGYGCQ